VPDVVIHGDSVRSPELRHEVPLAIGDEFLYVETGGRRHVVVSAFEVPRIVELGTDLEVHPYEEFGLDELVAEGGRTFDETYDEVRVRACVELGVRSAVVPAGFPLLQADMLRARGVELRPDAEFFDARRRVKNAFELAGMRRAQKAAEAGMDAARDLLRRAQANGRYLVVDGEPLTSERLKVAIERTFSERDCTADEFIVSHGPQSAIGHEMGHGPIAPGEPIVIDLWPKDRESGCYGDMTRTYVVGEASDELRDFHRLSLQALEEALAAIRPGAHGAELNRSTSDLFRAAGYETALYKEPGVVLESGFFHGLGHGVGLEVHEAPAMGRVGDTLVAGDVVTIEPGLYRRGYGGCRLEDMVLVTDTGFENLNDYPYNLEP
jgi:Xaa-Pro aminopeptidase